MPPGVEPGPLAPEAKLYHTATCSLFLIIFAIIITILLIK